MIIRSLNYVLYGNQMKAVSNVKDLGIHITSNLLWSLWTNKCANKTNSMLRFISLTVGPRNPELFSKLYKGLVRPILEYCYLVWPPHLKKDSAILEKEQRRACRFTLRNIGWDTSCEEPFKFLKWPLYIREDYFLRLPSATRRFTV